MEQAPAPAPASKTQLRKTRKAARALRKKLSCAETAAPDPLAEVPAALRCQLSDESSSALVAVAAMSRSAVAHRGRAGRRQQQLHDARRDFILSTRELARAETITAVTKEWLFSQFADASRFVDADSVRMLSRLAIEHPAICYAGEHYYAAASERMRRTLDSVVACEAPRDATEAAVAALVDVEARFHAGHIRERDYTSVLSGFCGATAAAELSTPGSVAVALRHYLDRCVEVDGTRLFAISSVCLGRACWMRVLDFVRSSRPPPLPAACAAPPPGARLDLVCRAFDLFCREHKAQREALSALSALVHPE